MVKITEDLLLKNASHSKRRMNETDQQYLKRLTHVYLQEKNIEEINGLSSCKNLSVLYLYENNIPCIQNLSFAINLTHLYLQKNKITHISGLSSLPNLQKLYLGYNCITVVEGLENNSCLTELHIEQQQLPLGEKLLFDPQSLNVISNCLSVLNVSGNKLEATGDLRTLRRLSHLSIEDNKLDDLSDLASTLLQMASLSRLDIANNPLCLKKKYRDKVIIMSKSLVMIDNREVSEATRQFLHSWYNSKQAKKNIQKKGQQQQREQAESWAFFTNSNFSSSTNHGHSMYHLATHNSSTFAPSSKHLLRHHRQFAEVLAKHRQLPPLEQTKPRQLSAAVIPNDMIISNDKISTAVRGVLIPKVT